MNIYKQFFLLFIFYFNLPVLKPCMFRKLQKLFYFYKNIIYIYFANQ